MQLWFARESEVSIREQLVTQAWGRWEEQSRSAFEQHGSSSRAAGTSEACFSRPDTRPKTVPGWLPAVTIPVRGRLTKWYTAYIQYGSRGSSNALNRRKIKDGT